MRPRNRGGVEAQQAKEELIAELSAAVISSQYGMSKHIKDDSAKYLKSWLGSLQQGPDFLKTVLGDVKRSSSLINERLESIQQEMEKGEEADYSRFRSTAITTQQSAQDSRAQAAKDVEQVEEVVHHHGRSR